MGTIAYKYNITLTKLFWTISISLIVFSGLYMFFISQTVFQAAQRESIEESLVEIQTNISELELALIDKKRMVTREYAKSQGFVYIEDTTFVKRDPGTRLSLRNE